MQEIELTQGKVALVDDEDYEELNKYSWCVIKNHCKGVYYAVRKIPDVRKIQRLVYMHRQILRLGYRDGTITDHINRDTLDNQRANLRSVSDSINKRNHKGYRNNTSGHNGVYWHKQYKKWRSQIGVNGKSINLGYFDDVDAAIEARHLAEIKYWGEPRAL